MNFPLHCNIPSQWDRHAKCFSHLHPIPSLFRFKSCIFLVKYFSDALLYTFDLLSYSLLCSLFLRRICLPVNLWFRIFQFFCHFSFYFLCLLVLLPFPFLIQNVSISLVRFCSVLDETVNADPIMMSDDKIDALDTPLAKELIHSSANVQPVERNHYRYEKVWMSVEDVVNLTSALGNILCSPV